MEKKNTLYRFKPEIQRTGFVKIFGSKIQGFFRIFFFQNNNLLFQTQGYQIGVQYRPLKRQNQSLFQDALQTYGQD